MSPQFTAFARRTPCFSAHAVGQLHHRLVALAAVGSVYDRPSPQWSDNDFAGILIEIEIILNLGS